MTLSFLYIRSVRITKYLKPPYITCTYITCTSGNLLAIFFSRHHNAVCNILYIILWMGFSIYNVSQTEHKDISLASQAIYIASFYRFLLIGVCWITTTWPHLSFIESSCLKWIWSKDAWTQNYRGFFSFFQYISFYKENI